MGTALGREEGRKEREWKFDFVWDFFCRAVSELGLFLVSGTNLRQQGGFL